jgi:hypothetical protein
MMLMACSAVGVAGYDTGSSSERMGSADQQCLKKIRARLCREHFLMKPKSSRRRSITQKVVAKVR